MPKKPNVEQTARVSFWVPAALQMKLELLLWSDMEQRVPHGAYRDFFTQLLRDYFENPRLDLTPFGLPGAVAGSRSTLEMLERRLNEHALQSGNSVQNRPAPAESD